MSALQRRRRFCCGRLGMTVLSLLFAWFLHHRRARLAAGKVGKFGWRTYSTKVVPVAKKLAGVERTLKRAFGRQAK